MTLIFDDQTLEEIFPDDTKLTQAKIYVCPHRGTNPNSYEVVITSSKWTNKYYLSTIDSRYIDRFLNAIQAQSHSQSSKGYIKCHYYYFVRYDDNNYFHIAGFNFYRRVGDGYDRVKFLEDRLCSPNNKDKSVMSNAQFFQKQRQEKEKEQDQNKTSYCVIS
jgi:hypothetical protein